MEEGVNTLSFEKFMCVAYEVKTVKEAIALKKYLQCATLIRFIFVSLFTFIMVSAILHFSINGHPFFLVLLGVFFMFIGTSYFNSFPQIILNLKLLKITKALIKAKKYKEVI